VQLNEELYEKQSVAENDKHLHSDVENFKSALLSISHINKFLDGAFLDRYDEITRELEARIHQVELENATGSIQGEIF
jgi:hypothetical protein